jgi:hypothetical protein
MEVDTPSLPQLPPMTGGRTIGPDDFVDEAALPHIVSLLEENSRRVAEKAEEWTPTMTIAEIGVES